MVGRPAVLLRSSLLEGLPHRRKLPAIKVFDPNALTRESRSKQSGLIILSKQEVIRYSRMARNHPLITRNPGPICFSPSSVVV
jgi:hypothetical protein